MLLHASSSRPGFQKRRYEGPSFCCSLRHFGRTASFQIREKAPSCVRVHGPLGLYREDFMWTAVDVFNACYRGNHVQVEYLIRRWFSDFLPHAGGFRACLRIHLPNTTSPIHRASLPHLSPPPPPQDVKSSPGPIGQAGY
jgi:hypothetical protein